MKNAIPVAIVLMTTMAMFPQTPKQSDGPAATIVGYLRDARCVQKFPEVAKPLPNGCLEACVRSGSPLVILTKNEEVYHPISSEIPDGDIRPKLLPYAGKLVKVSGHVYERGGSKAITLERIEEVKD